MKYFYDTEFLEDGTTIDLISIGIVAEDGREYYAVSEDMPVDRIRKHEWLMKNVFPHLPFSGDWKPKEQIAAEVKEFLLASTAPELWAWYCAYDHVVLAQLFGPMIDLPEGIPMYTHDLRAFVDYLPDSSLPKQSGGAHDALEDARWVKQAHAYATANNRGWNDARVTITPEIVNRAALAFCDAPDSPADACEGCRDDALAALRALR